MVRCSIKRNVRRKLVNVNKNLNYNNLLMFNGLSDYEKGEFIMHEDAPYHISRAKTKPHRTISC